MATNEVFTMCKLSPLRVLMGQSSAGILFLTPICNFVTGFFSPAQAEATNNNKHTNFILCKSRRCSLVLSQHNLALFLLSTQPGATGTQSSYIVDRIFAWVNWIYKNLQSGILSTSELTESKIDFVSINYSHSAKKMISNVRSTGATAQQGQSRV